MRQINFGSSLKAFFFAFKQFNFFTICISADISDMSDVLHSSVVSVTQQVDCNGHYGDDWMSPEKLCVSTASLAGPCYVSSYIHSFFLNLNIDAKIKSQGDAGSAIVREADDMVMGIFSFLDIQSCDSGFAVGFTRVGAYVDWINEIMAQ
jgi:Trypsin